MTTDKNTIYVVFGTTGEYSDRTEWPVRWFESEAFAKRFILKLEEIARTDKDPWPRYHSEDKFVHPLDPNYRRDYTGTKYFYYTVKR